MKVSPSVIGQVDPEGLHLGAQPRRRAVYQGLVHLRAGADVQRRRMAVLRAVQAGRVAQPADHAVEDVQEGQRQQGRDASAERVDPFLLVQLSKCLVEREPVVLVLLLKLLHLRLQFLHGEHRTCRLKCERHDKGHVDQAEEDDRYRVVGDQRVKPCQDPSHEPAQGAHAGSSAWGYGEGTGSSPNGPPGRHLTRRCTVKARPRRAPWCSRASSA